MEMKKTLVVAIIYGILVGSLSIALPLFLDSQGYSISTIGWVFAAAALVSGVMGIGLGAWSDRFGRRPLLIFYSLLVGGATFVIGWGGSIYTFIAGKAASDFSLSGLWNILISRISDLSKTKERAFYLGKYLFLFGIFYSAAHVLAGSIIDLFGFSSVFLLIIVFAVFGTVVTYFFVERGKRNEKYHFSFEILKTHDGKVQAIVSFFYGLGAGLVYTYVLYIFLSEQFNFTPTYIGIFIAATSVIWGVSSYFTGRLVDKFGMRKIFLLGALINCAAWLGISAFYPVFWLFLLFIIIDNISYSALDLSVIKAASVIPKEENLGRDVSVFGYAHAIGALIAVSTAGILAEMDYSYVFALRGIMFAAAGLIFWRWITIKE